MRGGTRMARICAGWGLGVCLGIGLMGVRSMPQQRWTVSVAVPTSVAVRIADAHLTLAVAQTERGRVRWWTEGQPGWIFEFPRPVGIGLDTKGRLWVGDAALDAVWVIEQTAHRLIGRCMYAPQLWDHPVDFAFAGDRVFVVDGASGHVVTGTADGDWWILLNGLHTPTAVAVLPDRIMGYRLFVTEQGVASAFQRNLPVVRMYRTDLHRTVLETEYGRKILEFPVAIVVSDRWLDVLDGHLAQVLRFDMVTGRLIGKTGGYGTGWFYWRNPSDMVSEGPIRVIADTGNNRLTVDGWRYAPGLPTVFWDTARTVRWMQCRDRKIEFPGDRNAHSAWRMFPSEK